MKMKELLNKLEELDFATSDFDTSPYYKENNEAEINIGIYARISKKNSEVIEQQIKAIEIFLEQKVKLDSQTMITKYFDDGFSGTSEGREGYNNMMRDLKLGRINVVITTNIDRFGRASENIIMDIYPEGRIKYLYISLDNKVINAPGNMHHIKQKAMTADDYAKNCSEKARRGLETRVYQGSTISSKPAYGYEIQYDNITKLRKYVLGKYEEVEVVKHIFESYLCGQTLGDITRDLMDKFITSPTGNSRWNKSTIESMLKNPLYAGQILHMRYKKQEYVYYGDGKKVRKTKEKEWIKCGEFNGIIDIQTYNTIQSMLNENKSTRSNKFQKRTFTGVLKCGDCGRALQYKEKWKGYKCSGSQRKEGNCSTHFVKEDELWSLTLDKINQKIERNIELINKNVSEMIKIDNGVKQKYELIEKNNKKIGNANHRMGKLYFEEDNTHINKLIKDIEEEIIKIQKQNDSLKQKVREDELLKESMLSILNNIKKYIKRENFIVKLFFKEIKVYQDNKIELIWRC